MLLYLACAPIESVSLCNGKEYLCDRPIDKVAFPATHNSMSSAENEWIAPNQHYAIPQQLEDGIRGLNLDTYSWEEKAYVCHGFCQLGAQPLNEVFEEIKLFLQSNPNEIILITFQSDLSAELTLNSFHESNLYENLYVHTLYDPWPTLMELIQNQTQVVAFSNFDGGPLGYHKQWVHWVDNPYSAREVEDFSCTLDRGDEETATLFNVNHFLTKPIALEQLAQQANINPNLSEHVFSCWQETGRFPNQVLVDFYNIGDLFTVVDQLNSHDGQTP
jgi:hypothetical protein